jgi:F0F1-type ATP synthase delta subunit
MKYQPIQYARAFAQALRAHADTADATRMNAERAHLRQSASHRRTSADELAKRFAQLIAKNGDTHHAPKIVAATEKLLHAAAGTKKVTLVAARPSEKIRSAFRHIIGAKDTVEEKVDPSLVAGVKVLINDEVQFDASLKRKLDKLFNI